MELIKGQIGDDLLLFEFFSVSKALDISVTDHNDIWLFTTESSTHLQDKIEIDDKDDAKILSVPELKKLGYELVNGWCQKTRIHILAMKSKK